MTVLCNAKFKRPVAQRSPLLNAQQLVRKIQDLLAEPDPVILSTLGDKEMSHQTLLRQKICLADPGLSTAAVAVCRVTTGQGGRKRDADGFDGEFRSLPLAVEW